MNFTFESATSYQPRLSGHLLRLGFRLLRNGGIKSERYSTTQDPKPQLPLLTGPWNVLNCPFDSVEG